MLIGEYQNSIDLKNRMIIPSKFRNDLGGVCILTRGLDNCIILYPMETWKKQEEKLQQLPMSDPEARAFRRYIYQNAFDCEIDKQGRVLIPQQLKESSGIDKELVTIGMLDRVEIWAKSVYDGNAGGAGLDADRFSSFSEKYQV